MWFLDYFQPDAIFMIISVSEKYLIESVQNELQAKLPTIPAVDQQYNVLKMLTTVTCMVIV